MVPIRVIIPFYEHFRVFKLFKRNRKSFLVKFRKIWGYLGEFYIKRSIHPLNLKICMKGLFDILRIMIYRKFDRHQNFWSK